MVELLAQESSGGSSLIGLLPLLLIGVVFYFLLIRPQQRRSRAQQQLQRDAGVGDEVVTTAGVFGTITELDEENDTVTLEIAPGTRIRMLRAGIGRIVIDDDEEPDADVPDGQDGPIQQA